MALILRTNNVKRIYNEVWSILALDKEAPDPKLPKAIIDQIIPRLRKKYTPAALRKWLTLTCRLVKLSDYLPFIAYNVKGPATFRSYKQSANKDIKQLCKLLNKDSRAQCLAKIGRAFRDRILRRQTFLWEDISCEKLSKLPNNNLLHLLTIRHNSIGKQCDLCKEERCALFSLGQDLASKQPTSPTREHNNNWVRVSSPNTTAENYHNINTGLCHQTQAPKTSPSASTSYQTISHNLSAALLTLVNNSAS